VKHCHQAVVGLAAFALALPALPADALVRAAPPPQKPTAFTYLPLPDKRFIPDAVVRATDDSLWFDARARVQCGPSQICVKQQFGRFANGHFSIFHFAPRTAYQGPAAGPDGTAWLTSGNQLFVYDSSGSMLTTFTIAGASELSNLQLGPDGRMWFTDFSNQILAIAGDGQVSSYQCPGFCAGMTEGRDGKLWGTGLDSDYQGFFYSITTGGIVAKYAGAVALVSGPGNHLWSASSTEIESIDRNEHLSPFADLQYLDLDQTIYVSSSNSKLWFTGSRAQQSQAVAGAISLQGLVTSEPFSNVPCSQTYVYLSSLVQAADGAMYGGFGCGDRTGTHAVYLVRVFDGRS
jgi:hypothetical protein